MEEEKAAAYYDELTRKGGNAARFKQGLGFSSSSSDRNPSDAVPARGSALPSSSSSFLSSFVRASSPSKSSDAQKQSQIESIQNKLKKKVQKHDSSSSPRVSDDRSRGRDSDRRSSRRRTSRSRSRDEDDRSSNRNRRNHRSSSIDQDRHRDRDRYRDRDRGRRSRSRSRSRSVSPQHRRLEKIRDNDRRSRKGKTGRGDDAKSIEGYNMMSPAERVKAKMKLQLSTTAKQDEVNGMGSGWERFNFDKDASLDDEEIEAAEDDGALVKHIGRTFRFSTVEARREEKIKATHDEAIFGTSSLAPPVDTDSEADGNNCTKEIPETAPAASLVSDQVRSLQQGSWRDRIHKA